MDITEFLGFTVFTEDDGIVYLALEDERGFHIYSSGLSVIHSP